MLTDYEGVPTFELEVGRWGLNEPATYETIDVFYGYEDLVKAMQNIVKNGRLCADDAILVRFKTPTDADFVQQMRDEGHYPNWYHYCGEDTPWGDGNVDDEDWGEPDDTYKVSPADYELLQRVKRDMKLADEGRMPEGEWTGGKYMKEV